MSFADRRFLVLVVAAFAFAGGDATASAYDPDSCDVQMEHQCCGDKPVILYMGCAPKQRIPLDLGPGQFDVFVNGTRVAGPPEELTLRADRYHVVYIKREGHIPKMVVLYTEKLERRHQLTPSQISLRLRPRDEPGRLTISVVQDDG